MFYSLGFSRERWPRTVTALVSGSRKDQLPMTHLLKGPREVNLKTLSVMIRPRGTALHLGLECPTQVHGDGTIPGGSRTTGINPVVPGLRTNGATIGVTDSLDGASGPPAGDAGVAGATPGLRLLRAREIMNKEAMATTTTKAAGTPPAKGSPRMLATGDHLRRWSYRAFQALVMERSSETQLAHTCGRSPRGRR